MASFDKSKKVCFLLPSLDAGGMEKVLTDIANFISNDNSLDVHLILLSRKKHFYKLGRNLTLHEPHASFRSSFRGVIRSNRYLRKKLKEINPHSLLSFGSKYNSFVILASLGLGIKVYVSDRSNPYRNTYFTLKSNPVERHDGILHYILKQVLYRSAHGIIVQTRLAAEIEKKSLGHKNIIYLPNPVAVNETEGIERENIILNVGRFISTKQQILLIDIFYEIGNSDWKLSFLGDGPDLAKAKERVDHLGISDRVVFHGSVKNVAVHYSKAKIFAFVSVSEGFPNSLGEALANGLACISFDCVAGPSDLIVDGFNGYLEEVGAKEQYKKRLMDLMNDDQLRSSFAENSKRHLKQFDSSKLLEEFKSILLS